ncbi:MAG: RNA pyrophosphohydrolase [Pseudomonadota bacterium]
MAAPIQLPYRPCAGVMLVNSAGLIFTAMRHDAPGAWQMPQGGIDKGEDPAKAAIRELYEETGIKSVEMLGEAPDWLTYDLPPHLLGKALKGKYRGQKQRWFALRFVGQDDEVDLEHHEPEFSAWRWSTPDQVIADIVDFKRETYRQVLAALDRYIVPA